MIADNLYIIWKGEVKETQVVVGYLGESQLY
jgi:hypothetical protein